MPHKEATILLVEDDEVDVMLVKRAFTNHKIANPVMVAGDGLIAFEKLKSDEVAKPYLVLLDLNMPRMNGHEFLEKIRNDSDLKSTVVFVLTTSKDEEDRWKAYEKNIAGYIVKERAGEDFIGAVSLLENYWRVVELP